MQKVESKDVFKEGYDWEKDWPGTVSYYPFVRERATHVLFIPMGMAKSLASTVYIQHENGFLKIVSAIHDKFVRFTEDLTLINEYPAGRFFRNYETNPMHSPFKREMKFLGWEKECAITGQLCGLHIPEWFNLEWADFPTAVQCTLEEWEKIKKEESISCVKYVIGVKGVKSRIDFINKQKDYDIYRYNRSGKAYYYDFMRTCGFTHKKESKTELKKRAFKSIIRRFKNKPITKSESSFFEMIIGAAKMKRYFNKDIT